MTEIFKIVCEGENCNNEIEIVSPATLSCNKCGCGNHKFPVEMEFKCFYGHKHTGRVSKVCKECINVERTMYRTFVAKKKVEKKQEEKKSAAPKKRTAAAKTTTTKSGIKRRKK